jgi:hypothetical protein
MKKIVMLAIIMSSSLLTGCAEVAYDILQDNQRDSCNKMMEPGRSQCLRNNSTDYETYQKQREKALRS